MVNALDMIVKLGEVSSQLKVQGRDSIHFKNVTKIITKNITKNVMKSL